MEPNTPSPEQTYESLTKDLDSQLVVVEAGLKKAIAICAERGDKSDVFAQLGLALSVIEDFRAAKSKPKESILGNRDLNLSLRNFGLGEK